MRFVLIIATGRSGSTTLQRIVNIAPNTLINGENAGICFKLIEAYISSARLVGNTHYPKPYSELVQNNIWPAMYNTTDFSKIRIGIKQLILSMFPNTETRGFKEITLGDRLNLIDIFVRIFPNSKIIFNIREDVESQSKSKWYAKNDKSIDALQNLNTLYKEYCEKNPKFTYLVRFEDLFITDKIKSLFSFLGSDFNEDEYKKILNNKLDMGDRSGNKRTADSDDPTDHTSPIDPATIIIDS
jgi:hypothetical protein